MNGLKRMYADNLLVEMDHLRKGELRTETGLIIVRSNKQGKEEPAFATVLACGPGWYPGSRCGACGEHSIVESKAFEAMPCQVGDRVLVESKLSGDVYMTDDYRELRIIRAANVIAVLEPEEAAAE